MRIVVTGANGDIGEAVGRILQEEFPAAEVAGADSAGEWPGRFVFSRVHALPRASAPEYLDALHDLARQVDLIIPTSEPELIKLSHADNILSQLPVLMVRPEILKTFMDKYDTATFLDAHGLNPPKSRLLSEIGPSDLPAYVKPRRGAGGRGHRLIQSSVELHAAQQVAPNDWVAQEYLPDDGAEYTCALCRLGGVTTHVALKRILQGDKTVRAEVASLPTIDALLERIAEAVDLDGCINVQLRMVDGHPRVFEINPRLSSTVMMRHRLGFDDCKRWVASFFGLSSEPRQTPVAGAVVYRMSTERVVPA